MGGGGFGGGKKNRSVTARVPVSWSEGLASTSVDSTMQQSDVIGFDSPRSMLTKLENSHKQPFIVYLTGEDKDAQRRQKVLNGSFLDERVGITAQVFCMIKGEGDGSPVPPTHPR